MTASIRDILSSVGAADWQIETCPSIADAERIAGELSAGRTIAERHPRASPGLSVVDRARAQHAEHLNGGTVESDSHKRAPRWVLPLDVLLGDEEPSDDDAGDWIVRDIVPRGEPALLAGPPKTGKTWAALDLAIDVALGRSWLGGAARNTFEEPTRVLVVALEDGERRLRRRVWELARSRGITPNDPTLRAHLSISRSPVRMPSDDVRAFTSELSAWKPALVIVDNVTRVLVGDPNSTRDVAAFTAAWCSMCLDVGAATLMIHHTRKGNGDHRGEADPFEAVRGSGDLVAAARHVMVMRPLGADRAIAELLARGNLDVQCSARSIELVRQPDANGRMVARLIDRGDPASLRASLVAERRTIDANTKRAKQSAELDRRRTAALEIARQAGCVSGRALAAVTDLGIGERTADATLRDLALSGVLKRDSRRGYVLADGGP